MPNDIPVKEISELLDEVSGKMPKLISGFMETLYSAEAGKKIGQAVGCFYKELLDSGIPQDAALKMAKDYMISIKEIAGIIKNNNE